MSVVALLFAPLLPRLRNAIFRPKTKIEALADAANNLTYRPIDGRLNGFVYRPLMDPPRNAKNWRLQAAAAALADESDAYVAGTARLLIGEYDRAVETLSNAALAEPHNARLLSALTAAYFARAKARDFLPDYSAALDAAERAWYLARTPETAWNRAVAIQAFHLVAATERAWSDYLSIDQSSPWRIEAEQRRAALQSSTEIEEWNRIEPQLQSWLGKDDGAIQRAVHRLPGPAIVYFEEKVLPQWTNALLTGDADRAARARRLALIIANKLATDGEKLPLDTSHSIEDVCRGGTCKVIASAHQRFVEGQRLVTRQEYARASAIFKETSATFDRLRSPYALVARSRYAVCMLYENRFSDAARVADALIASLDGRQYRTLAGRTLGHLGLLKLHEARPEESIAHYRAARQLFSDARDTAALASMELLLADAYEYAGDRDVAMNHRLASLAAMRRSGDSKQLHLALFEAGTSVSSRDQFAAADFFLDETVRESVKQHRLVVAALASMWRSMLASRLKDFAAAGEQSRLAAGYWSRMTDPGQRALVAANVNQAAASSTHTVSPADKITETIGFFEKAGTRAWLPQLLRQRALIHEKEGDPAAAEADFRQAIGIAEETLDRSAPATMRDGFAADLRTSYEDLIRLLLRKGESREALSYAERARLVGHGSNAGRDVLSHRGRAPDTIAAVYEIQPDGLVVWLIHQDSIRLFRSGDPKIGDRIAAALNGESTKPNLVALYDLLIRPWISEVTPETELAVLPSPSLAAVPFAALTDRRTGRAVIDDHPVSIASSLASLRNPPVTLSDADSILIIGDPDYRQFRHLPASRKEALEIASHYRNPILLLGPNATAREAALHMPRVTALHFAGHAVVNDLAPERSSMILGEEDGQDSRIYVHELLERSTPFKLVILSACSTARRSTGPAASTLTIGQAFLDGGSDAVVGTLWPVPDDVAARFSAALHRSLAQGEDVVRATRFAQRQVKSNPDADASWAAFCVLQGTKSQKEAR